MMNNIQLKFDHYQHSHLPQLPISSIVKASISPFKLSFPHNAHLPSSLCLQQKSRAFRVSDIAPIWDYQEKDENFDDLALDSPVYQKTLRLVECSMFAAVSGLAYVLSNSLAIENYFGCFFALPILISSMKWGIAAGRKTMVATAVLLLVLSGPVKALTYVLMHGLLGFMMGSLWRLKVSWSFSIILCTMVRAVGALGFVLTSSFLIRENILAVITINLHAIVTMILNSLGFNTIPSMNTIYAIFGTVLLLNCICFVFLLHVLYALFLTRLGMKASLMLPKWLESAL